MDILYGYIRTSRQLVEGEAGSDPETLCLRLLRAGVDPDNICRDVGVFGWPAPEVGPWRGRF